MQKIGIAIPSYNETESICDLIQKIQQITPGCEIVVVDDSPQMTTVHLIEARQFQNLKLIHRTEKGGRGSAILEGLRYLITKNCDFYIDMDADFSHPPEQIPELIQIIQSRQLQMLIGSRYLPESRIVNWPLSRRIFSKLSNWLARCVLQIPIHDYTNGYRCYSRSAAELIVKHCGKIGKGFISLSEILVQLYFNGYTVGEIPTRFINRVRGESSVNHKEITNALTGLFKIYFLKKRLQKSAHGIMEKSHH